MCLISAAPKGTEKYSEFFLNSVRNGAKTNTDGSGFACKSLNSDVVFYSKGFTNIEELIDSLRQQNLTKDDELVVHSRTGNTGIRNSKENTHPYVISDSQKEIIDLMGVTEKPVIFHNGTFSKYIEVGSIYSDTYHLTKQFLCIPEVTSLLKRDAVTFAEVFKDKLSYNKLAVLSGDANMILIGNFIEDQGYQFSNFGYKRDDYYDIGGQEYNPRYASFMRRRHSEHLPNPNIDKNIKLLLAKATNTTDKNPYNIPVNNYTIRDLLYQRENDLGELEYYYCYERNDVKDHYLLLYPVTKEISEGKDKLEDLPRMIAQQFYLWDVLKNFTILPRVEHQKKYSDFVLLDVMGFNKSNKQFKKITGAFHSSGNNTEIKIKGIKDTVDRQAVILYMKENSDGDNKLKKNKVPIVDELFKGTEAEYCCD